MQYAQTYWGKALLLGAFTAGLYLHQQSWWLDVGVMLAVVTYLPAWRTYLLPLGSLYWLCFHLNLKWQFVLQYAEARQQTEMAAAQDFKRAIIAAVILFCFLFSKAAHRYARLLPFKRSLTTLFLVFFTLLASLHYLPISASSQVALWAFIVVLSRYFWYLGYSLAEARNKNPKSFIWQFGHYFGFWSSNHLDEYPVPKGAAQIRKIEAKNGYELALCQLKGLKLLIWAMWLKILAKFCLIVFYNVPSTFFGPFEIPFRVLIPSYQEVYNHFVQNNPYPVYIGWIAIIGDRLIILLQVAFYGHLLIAMCRMVGLNALRNTYRPLDSKCIMDYWNRFHFYFKEMLVDMFFYPAFFRYFKNYPKLRLFFATFCAAGIGNLLAHVLSFIEVFPQYGVAASLRGFAHYLPYITLLSLGIWISQLRQQRAAPVRQYGFFRREVLSRLGVWVFIILIHPFDHCLPNRNLLDSLRLMAYLFGINLND